MLFLLNKMVVEVESPELHLARYWKRIGCGDPANLRAEEAVNFAAMVMTDLAKQELSLSADTAEDIAALIVSKTGANAALFGSGKDVRLNELPEAVLRGLKDALDLGIEPVAADVWTSAA